MNVTILSVLEDNSWLLYVLPTVISVVGMVWQLALTCDALTTLRLVRRHGIGNGRLLIARAGVWNSLTFLVVLGVNAIVNVVGLWWPPHLRSFETTLVLRLLLITMLLVVMVNSARSQSWRRRLLDGE